MQLPLPLLRSRGGVSVVPLQAGARTVALKLVRHRRARRYVLRVTESGDVVVTLPRWGSISEARAFAEKHLRWIERERVRRMAESHASAWTESAEIWLRGERRAIERDGDLVRVGDVVARLRGGDDVKSALRAALRAKARQELPARLGELAAHAGLRVARVSIRDQRSRWGSCSTRGSIALNWRLVLMPPAVRDYVLWHELMHLKRADHSPAFWKLVAQVCPDYASARAWLAAHGRELA